jgi:hypothetical protein
MGEPAGHELLSSMDTNQRSERRRKAHNVLYIMLQRTEIAIMWISKELALKHSTLDFYL